MAPRKADDLTLCGSNDKLKSYFDQHAVEEHLTCVEFEPTYWFGEYEIPGLKLYTQITRCKTLISGNKVEKLVQCNTISLLMGIRCL